MRARWIPKLPLSQPIRELSFSALALGNLFVTIIVLIISQGVTTFRKGDRP
jgi:hypothetical protein